jgi:hypothetical protein
MKGISGFGVGHADLAEQHNVHFSANVRRLK